MNQSLTGRNSGRKVTAYDIFGHRHQKNLADFKFRISVYGILQTGTKILLQRHPLIRWFGLPGGGLELGETITACLKREFYEETGILTTVGKLIDVSQDFFTHDGKCAHSILVFYRVEKISGELTTNHEDSAEVKYFDLSELTENNVQRIFWPIVKKLKLIKVNHPSSG